MIAVWTVRQGLPYAYPPSAACLAAGRDPYDWAALPLLRALRQRWARDSWFQTVTVPGWRRWPRLSKAILLELATGGELRPVLSYAALDLDRPDHRSDPWPSAGAAAEAVHHVAERLRCSVYATRGGLRAVWRLAHPIPIERAQSFLDQLHARIPTDLPVPRDVGVKDWTRGYRVPWCPRADGKVPAWGDAAPPSDLRRLEAGEVLRWAPRELAVEQGVKLRRVVWPEPTATANATERRIEGIVRLWVRRIGEASSRHAVLLSAGRHVGGLCAAHGVSPARFVAELAQACDSANAERTVQTAVDYGAHEPITLPPDRQASRLERAYARVR